MGITTFSVAMTGSRKQKRGVWRLPDQERYPVKVQVKQRWCNTYLAYHLYKDSISAFSKPKTVSENGLICARVP